MNPTDEAAGAPQLQIGLIFATASRGAVIPDRQEIVSLLENRLCRQFPQFKWQFETASSSHHTEDELRDPLHLVETAFREKISRGWDAAILVTGALIRGTTQPFAAAIPASALEVGITSCALFEDTEAPAAKISAVITLLLGSLWGLSNADEGAMHFPDRIDEIESSDFNERQTEWLEDRLSEIADTRLEEKSGLSSRRNLPLFYFRSLMVNPRSIASDVIGYRPWLQPFRLARLTAAAVVSMLFVFLGAEAWEIGFHLSPVVLSCAAVLSVLVATAAIYSGQNLSEIAPVGVLTEQLARTRIVLFLCVLVGMITLGIVLFAISFLIASALPGKELASWTGVEPTLALLARFSVFSALLGVLAGALGGNLEENDNLKARFFFDEEI